MAEKTPVVRLKQPLCRFLNFILVILALNGLSSVILWLVGGDSDYLERNVEHFHIDKSVFDIAVIDFLKSIILIWFYMKLETLSIKMGFDVMNTELKGSRSLYFFLTFVLTVGSLAYSTTKGILIYLSWHKHGKAMHIMYYAATITSFAFGIIEVLIFIANVLVLRKLRLQCLALDAEKGQSSTEGEKKEKKKVNIARLAKLAKPVSSPAFLCRNQGCLDFCNLLSESDLTQAISDRTGAHCHVCTAEIDIFFQHLAFLYKGMS